MGTASSAAQLLFIPAAAALAPSALTVCRRLAARFVREPHPSWLHEALHGPFAEGDCASWAGTVLGFAVAAVWYLGRQHPWTWLLQDSLSMCLCIVFVRTLALPSLSVGSLFLGLMFCYDIFMVFISPLFFHGTSVMVAVATAGMPSAHAADDGTCSRTAGAPMPMLMQIPALSVLPVDALGGVYETGDAAADGATSGFEQSFLWRLSGAHGGYAMIGLGDIVLPALALAYARRIDLALGPSPGDGGSASGGWCGYFPCAVLGYGLGLLVTQAANVYRWTFNDVAGQPALLYLVPGVVGSQLLLALTRGQLAEVWSGSPLPQPPPGLSGLSCDGCRRGMFLDEPVFAAPSKNLDYCGKCYTTLPPDAKTSLTEQMVYKRCGVDPPPTQPTLL